MSKTIIALYIVFIAVLSSASYAAKTDTGEKSSKSLGDLPCATGEQARFDGSNWVCDGSLTVLEAQSLDSRLGSVESQVSVAQSTANSAQTTANDASARVAVLEGQDLENRFNALEGIALDAHGLAIEANALAHGANAVLHDLTAQDLPNRISEIEGLNLDTRLSDIETNIISPSRVISVSANGLSSIENGQALLDAVDLVANSNPAPSASEPYLILVYPGNYDLGTFSLNLPDFVSIKGFDVHSTVISSSGRVVNVRKASVESLSIISPIDNGQTTAVGVAEFAYFDDVYVEGRWGIGSSGAVKVTNSTIKVNFKCLQFFSEITFENSICEGSTFFDIHGGVVKVSNSIVDGSWTVFDGVETSIEVSDSKLIGHITPTNVTPFPTQNVDIVIRNSDVNVLNVGFSASSVNLLFSEVNTLNQTDGNLFMSHSIIESLNAPSGTGNFVSSQLGTPVIGTSIICPFSYDDNYQPLSGNSC